MRCNKPPSSVTTTGACRRAILGRPIMPIERLESLDAKGITLVDISRVIAETRARRQLTERQLAQLAGISQPWIDGLAVSLAACSSLCHGAPGPARSDHSVCSQSASDQHPSALHRALSFDDCPTASAGRQPRSRLLAAGPVQLT